MQNKSIFSFDGYEQKTIHSRYLQYLTDKLFYFHSDEENKFP